jgi:hypothetical protein
MSMTLDPSTTFIELRLVASSRTFPAIQRGELVTIGANRRAQEARVWGLVPLQMSLWPRGRTLVSGWSRRFSSTVVAAGGTSTGMVRPANLTWTVMVGCEIPWLSMEAPSPRLCSIGVRMERQLFRLCFLIEKIIT